MVSIVTLTAVDPGFNPLSRQTKDLILVFIADKHAALRSKRKYSVKIMCSCGPTCLSADLFQWAKYPTKCVDLEQSGHNYHLIEI